MTLWSAIALASVICLALKVTGYLVPPRLLEAPRPTEVRVRVVATGVCHTDMVVRDQLFPTPLPIILGHEGAGVVDAVGSAVTTVQPGDHVGQGDAAADSTVAADHTSHRSSHAYTR